MNEPIPRQNKSYLEGMMTKKDFKEVKVMHILTRCTFFLGDSIIDTSWLKRDLPTQFCVGLCK